MPMTEERLLTLGAHKMLKKYKDRRKRHLFMIIAMI